LDHSRAFAIETLDPGASNRSDLNQFIAHVLTVDVVAQAFALEKSTCDFADLFDEHREAPSVGHGVVRGAVVKATFTLEALLSLTFLVNVVQDHLKCSPRRHSSPRRLS